MTPDENMHNMFHDYIGGTMSQVAISANDPIFFLHHNFIDKILETWITGRNQSFIIYPANDHPGQNSIDCAMPFIPCYRHENLLRTSKDFGYNFS
ncbi:tyrosinase-like [Hyperolius riggenbachi]|uniref:tyrosinase-like n=1 Tax=Hyperolius riggenbachi TaxID=752182 RepID=UPI0035A3111A